MSIVAVLLSQLNQHKFSRIAMDMDLNGACDNLTHLIM